MTMARRAILDHFLVPRGVWTAVESGRNVIDIERPSCFFYAVSPAVQQSTATESSSDRSATGIDGNQLRAQMNEEKQSRSAASNGETTQRSRSGGRELREVSTQITETEAPSGRISGRSVRGK